MIRPTKALHGFVAKADALVGPNGATIPAERVQILRERYLMVTHPTDSTSTVGLWPEPLPPLDAPIDLEANRNQPLWVRVTVPRDAPAGTYRGRIQLSADGWSDSAALEVKVFNFALPDRMTCASALGFSPHNVWRYQKLEKVEDRRAVLEKYLASFASHHISTYDPAPLDPIKVTWDRKTLTPKLDFTAWDSAIERAINVHHFNTFQIHIPGMGGGTFHQRVDPQLLGFREDSPEYKTAFTNYCRILQQHLRDRGWLKEAFVYWFDEPDRKDYAFVSNGFRKLKSAAPI